MTTLRRWASLPAFILMSGCFYTYNNYYGPDGGSGSSSGSSSGGSATTSGSSSGTGSTGSSSSSGAASSSGSSGFACASPDAGSIKCSAEEQIFVIGSLPTSYPLWDLTMVALPGGDFLVGVLLGQQGGVQFIEVAPDGGAWDAGIQGCLDTTNNTDCPSFAISLAASGAGGLPTLVGGYFPPGVSGTGTDEFACWSPFNGASPVAEDLSNAGANGVEIDKLSAASVNGQIAVGVTDYLAFQDALLVGSVAGGCPAAASATVLHAAEVQGLAVTPSGITGTPFLTAEAINGPPDKLTVTLAPKGGSYQENYGSTGANFLYWPAAASDGTTFTALTGSDSAGIQLFTGSIVGLGPIFDGGVLAPPPSFSLSATSCGTGCALAGWVENAGGEDGGPETPTFAFVDPNGCAEYVTMDSFTDDLGRNALTAVASQSGTVAIVYASSYEVGGPGFLGGRVNLRLCTP